MAMVLCGEMTGSSRHQAYTRTVPLFCVTAHFRGQQTNGQWPTRPWPRMQAQCLRVADLTSPRIVCLCWLAQERRGWKARL